MNLAQQAEGRKRDVCSRSAELIHIKIEASGGGIRKRAVDVELRVRGIAREGEVDPPLKWGKIAESVVDYCVLRDTDVFADKLLQLKGGSVLGV